ncbi:MAG TPA: diphthine--ammonia ligase [Chitinophagaceae bacterium]|nr:diphthine--ammonia ligase [Chitinophagaceae bacterium]
MTRKVVCSWSGGKDSCFALMQVLGLGYRPAALLNVLNEEGQISRSHGIPATLLQQQAECAGLPIHLVASSWPQYEARFTGALQELKAAYQLTHAVFGDIDLQAHRDWEESVCTRAGLQALLPLWKQDRLNLVSRMLEAGLETLIVSCNAVMGPRYLGRTLSPALVDELVSLGVDPCGENGEYHTLVLDCPLFSRRLEVRVTGTRCHDGYWFAGLEEQA